MQKYKFSWIYYMRDKVLQNNESLNNLVRSVYTGKISELYLDLNSYLAIFILFCFMGLSC